ncbi:DUF4870 domain-containing protein [Parafrigoribacterium soli]|uniref:DUF4870 domain-containing protein n=1 Tax=Parafrigoribacterium soli TaxID=3144663 RepID=UPI0032EE2830
MTDSTPPTNPYRGSTPLSAADEKLWATLVHVGGIFFHILPSLIGYLILKERGPFIRQHTASALNFQLTLIIAYIVGAITTILLIGVVILLAAVVANVVFSILAAIAANRGESYVYPLAIRFAS